MSFDNPSSFAHWQSSLASGSEKPSQGRPNRPPQSVWGQPTSHAGTHRGLTPLATSNAHLNSSSASRRIAASSSPGPQASATSPASSSFPSLLSSATRTGGGNRQVSSGSSTSPFPSLQTGGQNQSSFASGQSATSPRSRTITPLSQFVGGPNQYTQAGLGAGGGGGVGAGARSGTYSPSPVGGGIASPTSLGFERSIVPNAGSSTSGPSSAAKISVTQVLILVDTISEKEGKAKFESKLEQIRKLVESNGMEVFSKYFARLVSRNAAQIFSNAKTSDSGSNALLQEEVRKVSWELGQASKIAETIDISEGDIFKDFDLVSFIEYFKLEPAVKCLLALAFRGCSRADLRSKAENYLTDLIAPLVRTFAKPPSPESAASSPSVALLIESLAIFPPRKFGTEHKQELDWATRARFHELGTSLPQEVASALQMLRIPEEDRTFLMRLQKVGYHATATPDAADDLLTSIGLDKLSEAEVANALLFMALSTNAPHFKAENFTSAVRSNSRVRRLDWQQIVRGFDLPGLLIESETFLRLFNALLPVAVEEPEFDIQALWGGSERSADSSWQHEETQLSFLKAYLFCSPDDIDTSRIPNFRPSFLMRVFDTATDDTKQEAEEALRSHIASADALSAVFDLVLESDTSIRKTDSQDIVNFLLRNPDYLSIFLLSAPHFPGTWTPAQVAFVTRCFTVYLQKQFPNYQFVLDGIFRQSPQWTFQQCQHIFNQNPMATELIVERSDELGWTDKFLEYWTPLALDIACVRHRDSDEFDIEKYLRDIAENPVNNKGDVAIVLSKYLRIKADAETRTQRDDQVDAQSVSLALKTVSSLLLTLEDLINDPDSLAPIQRICLHAYPRLINYGEGFDDILETSCTQTGHKIPGEVDKRMSELFGKMYRNEFKIREVIELMKRYKTSKHSEDQDLFCCIIHGLFDEYACFHEYPLDALVTTAVLFGSIINFRLIAGVPLHVGLALVLDAVRDYGPEDLMFKFGVEALEQLRDRLPEWLGFCGLLVGMPSLQGEDIHQTAQEILRDRGQDIVLRGGADFRTDADADIANGAGDPFSMANGTFEEFLSPETMTRAFRALRADPPTKGRFSDPEPAAQEKILFVINNTSNDNLTSKIQDLTEVLKDEHYQWFASYLVEQRARLEPNNQEMYVRLLETINDKVLMAEVLRETYVCAVKMMNADSTSNSATERTHLKNLGGWLGSLTIAKDRPIKHKNIYFTDLLVEGHLTERLPMVIPFTCKVLVQGARSTVFKPPNPWLMEIIGLLLELYDNVVDLKLNLKFEIEVLCKDIGLDHKKVERSTILQDQTHHFDDSLTNVSGQVDGLDFDDLPLNTMNRGARSRLSTAAVISKLQSLAEQLKYPPTSSGAPNQELVKSIVFRAFEQAIQEIINPVVERSITIASISTAQLIAKDYACEADEEKYRSAARQMVKSLAGNLALVTCKEPLRMSITNYIRRPTDSDLPEQLMPEGAILMCVNDNLDLACSLIAESAEENSIAEIDLMIEPDLEERRRFQAESSDRPFLGRSVTRWALYVPEPFKLSPGGLNEVQQTVYDDFDRRLRGVGTNHAQNASTDSTGRQVPDILQDSLGIAHLSTPAEQPAVPHQVPVNQDEIRSTGPQQPRVNGFTAHATTQERIHTLIFEIQQSARSSSSDRIKDLEKGSPIISNLNQVLLAIHQSVRPPPELMARFVAQKVMEMFPTEVKSELEADMMVFLLERLCDKSEITSREVFKWIVAQEDNILANVQLTVALLEHGLFEFPRLDGIIGKALQERKIPALQLLSEVMDRILFVDEQIALRADFAGSLEAMNRWLADTPDLGLAVDINRRLKANRMPQFVNVAVSDKVIVQHDQMRYIFDEWIRLYQGPTNGEQAYASFLKDLHQKQVINCEEDSATFFRLCIDNCVEQFDNEARKPSRSLDAAYLHTDALARLMILLVKLQGESNGVIKVQKSPYLDSILSLVVLVQNHHQVTRGVAFNQRVFYRLYSTTLYEYASNGLLRSADNASMMCVFADKLLALQPAHFPAFVYGWLTLISHRVFLGGILSMANDDSWMAYRRVIEVMLAYVSEMLKSPHFAPITVELYRGALKVLLILHHDFPEFLCENHFFLCKRIPYHCTQLRNLVLSAYSHSIQELPDSTTLGLKVERLDETKRAPVIVGDISIPLSRNGLKVAIDGSLRKSGDVESAAGQITSKLAKVDDKSIGLLSKGTGPDTDLISSIVLYVGTEALAATGRFDQSAPHTMLFHKLIQTLKEEDRYALFNAMFDNVRYTNTHTNYFSKLLLHIFGIEHVNQQNENIRAQIVRVASERFVIHRPHPWGLMVFWQELMNNQAYRFWELPFLVASPDIRQAVMRAMQRP